MADGMKSYTQASGAMRDTTTWLVALVPGAGAVLVGTELVPDWLSNDLSSGDATTVLLMITAAGAAAATVVAMAVRVLRTDIAGWDDLRRRLTRDDATDKRTLRYQVEASGIVNLYRFESVAAVATAIDGDNQEDKRDLLGIASALVDYADYRTTAKAFRQFLVASAFCVAVIVAAVVEASGVVADAPDTIEVPTAVVVHVTNPDGLPDGCSATKEATIAAVATGGTWVDTSVVGTESSCEGIPFVVTPALGTTVEAS